jgi:hypothetical protein
MEIGNLQSNLQQLKELVNLGGTNSPLGGSGNSSDTSALQDALKIVQSLLEQLMGDSGGTPGASGGAGEADGTGGAGGAGGTGGAGETGGAGGTGEGGGMGGTGEVDLQKDSGALAGYMRQHDMKSLDANTLEQLATDKSGKTPTNVSQAARDMLANPDAYKSIETNDVAGADGKSSVDNFENAAQGLVSGVGEGGIKAGGEPGAHGTPGGKRGADLEKDSGALAGFMRQHGMKSLDANTLLQLSTDKSGKTPTNVSEAARDMLANPDAYKSIETNDVAGADGKSGVDNFEKAAQGLISGVPNGAGGAQNLHSRVL